MNRKNGGIHEQSKKQNYKANFANMCNKKEHSCKINQKSKLERLHETMESQKTTA